MPAERFDRRQFLRPLVAGFVTFFVTTARADENQPAPATQPAATLPVENDMPVERIEKTEAEWRKILSPTQYHVLREEGTERAFTGETWDNKKTGTYLCAGCGLPLFSSQTKYESGTGWPSFWEPVDPDHVALKEDRQHGMVRTEAECARCGGHLGHVFDDGPEPTGQRYCLNSAALKFAPADATETP